METGTTYPVPYATVQIKNSSKGVVANVDGDFRIPYRYKAAKDTIIVSCLGYETKKIALSSLNDLQTNIINLNTKIEGLDQILIKGKRKPSSDINAYTLVKKAIANIPNNYPSNKYASIGYYRDYQIIRDEYYNLNEAIIESFDAGFQTDIMMDDYNESAILSYKENNDFPRDKKLLAEYDGQSKYIQNTILSGQGGNELGILNIHNPIRNFEHLSFSFVYVFKKKFLENHEFEVLRKVYLNDDVIYEIGFKAKKFLIGSSHLAKGKIYIAKQNFAIHKLEYSVFEVNNSDPLFEVEIEYQPKGEMMYLNYITFNNRFVVSDDFTFDIENVEFVVPERAFHVKFNNKLKVSTVDRRDFKFKYQKKKLQVESFEIIDKQTVRVTIADWSLPKSVLEKGLEMKDFEYRIKNIYDVTNRKLLKNPNIQGYQFREFFTQDIFENKAKPNDLSFIKKYKPLSEAEVNDTGADEDYWMNTPLKTNK
ncbi:carboxypeptidase-like regulatory domain-containing protein [uncultured Psychroserpens sp.]|uniref:carboxypeptidase-like regulatory domain-containing protein n=1 Tax=uncultured Psychroserpens sp. TaxID=255436 RepID=UPI002619A544|nr:carboxypeptidase-like regulatory domain-containing protein [uncultured Psychroserpens sp.]